MRWDDLKVLLAAYRAGTLLGAASTLETHASTIGRRLEALEQSLGGQLFDRTPSGLIATELAESLLPLAEAMEARATDVQRLVEGRETEPRGWVRVTAPPGVATFSIAPTLPRLHARYPELRVELVPSVAYADLTRREADIAVRVARPTAGDLVTTRLGEDELVPLVSEALDAELGAVRDLNAVRWIQWSESLGHLADAAWVREHVEEERIVLRCSTFEPMVLAAQAGMGALMGAVSLMPPGLTRLRTTRALRRKLAPFPRGALYLVGHRALRDVPRVAAVWSHLLHEVAA
jgi:DNA-binding transcriptional LysR family regulator